MYIPLNERTRRELEAVAERLGVPLPIAAATVLKNALVEMKEQMEEQRKQRTMERETAHDRSNR